MNQSKLIGLILMAIGAIVVLFAAVWSFSNPGMAPGARVLAIFFGMVVGAPLAGIGLFTFNKGNSEAGEDKVIKKQQKLLSMVMTQGKVGLSSAAIELGSTGEEIKQLVRDLVGKQLFSGYVDWDGGMLYSVEASKLKEGTTCPKCGGKLELAGKGLIKCPYCGSEIFTAA